MLELLLTTLSDQKGTTNMTDYLLQLKSSQVSSLYPMFLQSKYFFIKIKILNIFLNAQLTNKPVSKIISVLKQTFFSA